MQVSGDVFLLFGFICKKALTSYNYKLKEQWSIFPNSWQHRHNQDDRGGVVHLHRATETTELMGIRRTWNESQDVAFIASYSRTSPGKNLIDGPRQGDDPQLSKKSCYRLIFSIMMPCCRFLDESFNRWRVKPHNLFFAKIYNVFFL
jgi:hypothetical protein